MYEIDEKIKWENSKRLDIFHVYTALLAKRENNYAYQGTQTPSLLKRTWVFNTIYTPSKSSFVGWWLNLFICFNKLIRRGNTTKNALPIEGSARICWSTLPCYSFRVRNNAPKGRCFWLVDLSFIIGIIYRNYFIEISSVNAGKREGRLNMRNLRENWNSVQFKILLLLQTLNWEIFAFLCCFFEIK